MIIPKKVLRTVALSIAVITASAGLISMQNIAATKKVGSSVSGKDSAYLFAYFTGNGPGEEAVRFALSADGYNYKALNGNNPVVNSADVSSAGGLRDPHILRGADGKTFYMVATDMNVAKNGWGPNYAMVFLKSTDLIHWKSSVVNIPQTIAAFAGINRVWAPQTIYDNATKKYMVYWSMRFGDGPDKIYYAYANAAFTGIEGIPKQLFFKPDNGATIDGTIAYYKGQYNLFFKTEGHGKGIKKAVSSNLTSGYVLQDNYLNQTTESVEGADVFKLINSDTWILMYDVYMKGKYQFCKSTDLNNFSVIDNEISMDFHPRHGTVIHISAGEAKRLEKQWRK